MIVTVTLSPGSLPGLASGLGRLGHHAVEAPLLHFRGPDRWDELDAAIGNLHRYTALGLTSPRASLALARRLEALGYLELPTALRIWAVGAATAAPLAAYASARAPTTSRGAEGLASAMLGAGEAGPVLYPCAEEVRSEFATRLRGAGRRVDEVIVYRAVLASPEQVAQVLRDADIALIGSHRVLERAAETTRGRRRPALICLGPSTAATAAALGWTPAAIAPAATTEGALAAVATL
jgi:uroporphyrinogen-III synthase